VEPSWPSRVLAVEMSWLALIRAWTLAHAVDERRRAGSADR